MNKTILLISSVIVCVVIFTITACNGDKLKEAKAEVARQEATQEEEAVEPEFGKDVYVSDNVNDENVATVTEPYTTVSYWYVFFEVKIANPENSWEGFKIVELHTPYFTIDDVTNNILPNSTENDYVGVKFFKRVPVETYKAYLANRKK